MRIANTIKIWQKRLLTTQYGYDRISPMSPSTMKIERHDPGGLLWWEDLAEIGINLLILAATFWIAARIDPVFAIIWVGLAMGVLVFFGLNLRFKLFKRRPGVTTRYVPAEIPDELIARYKKANDDLLQANIELEEIAAANGIEYCAGLRATVSGRLSKPKPKG